jgi:hypothetical protein
MNTILEALGDPTIRNWYLAFYFAVMVLPMIGIQWWYSTTIRKTEGGRRLMQRQRERPPRPGEVHRNLSEAAAMARDIASGKYGKAARTTQNRVYWMAGLWFLANIVVLSLLLWADEVNRYGKSPLYEGKNQYQDKGLAPTPGSALHGDTK